MIYFQLIFSLGICLEALCCPRSSQPASSTSTCLKALVTLLQCAQSRAYLISSESNSLGVELSNVLHRLMLTRDSPQIQLLVIDALELVLKADGENLNSRRAAKVKGLQPKKLFACKNMILVDFRTGAGQSDVRQRETDRGCRTGGRRSVGAAQGQRIDRFRSPGSLSVSADAATAQSEPGGWQKPHQLAAPSLAGW